MSILEKPVKFLQEVRQELLRVTWPGRNEVTKLTVIVVTVSLIIGFLLGGIDFILTKITEIIIKR